MTKRKKKSYPAAEPVEKVAEPVEVFAPAVSVIVPMHDAGSLIAECLDSLLAQTFTNFEIIIVDDCSTDSSPAIVQSIAPQFGGRLVYFRLKSYSGGKSVPCNTGIALARGEYVRFLDAEDRLVETALEEDFKLARATKADVVWHTRFYNLSADGTKGTLAAEPKYQDGDKIILDGDLFTRAKELTEGKYYLEAWRSFSRRDFLIADELYFPNMHPYEDIVWSQVLLIHAERFLRVPSAVYLCRENKPQPTSDETSRLKPIVTGLKTLDAFLSRHELFKTKPQLYYTLLENYFSGRLAEIFKEYSEPAPFELYAALQKIFGKDLGDQDVLIPALCSVLVQQQRIAEAKVKQVKEYSAQAAQRIAELEGEIKSRAR